MGAGPESGRLFPCERSRLPRQPTGTEDGIWAEADAFTHDPTDDWYCQPPGDEPRELTYVDEDTFWREF